MDVNTWDSLSGLWINQSVCKVLKWLLLLFTFHDSVYGKDMGPSYTNTERPCSSNNECSTSIGEICWWFYDGCSHGQCMCDPRTHFLDSSGRCRKVKFGGESCYPGDACPRRMSCIHGRCACSGSRGRGGSSRGGGAWDSRGGDGPADVRMTVDGRFCLRPHERLLGQTCNKYTNKCFQPRVTGYDQDFVDCIDGRCRCKPGYREEGGKCRKLNISEHSCRRDHHCQGGALCVGKMCICPTGYTPVAGYSKCAKQGAIHDLTLGAYCDETKQRRYCGEGLVCHRCPSQDISTCVVYKEHQTYNSALVGAGVDRRATIVCIVLGLVATVLFLLIRYYCCR